MTRLADVLVRVAVRELTARRAGKEKARAPLTQANGIKRLEHGNDNREIEEKHTLQELR